MKKKRIAYAILWLLIGALALMTIPTESTTYADESLYVTHGAAAGDVTPHSAVIWSRANREGIMHVTVSKNQNSYGSIHKKVRVYVEHDFTGKIKIDKLSPDTLYYYHVWFGNNEHLDSDSQKSSFGAFRTAPSKDDAKPVKFGWGGDLAGQNVCRDSSEGFPIFMTIEAMELNFFVGLGDMIYADSTCNEIGKYGNRQISGDFVQSFDIHNFWAHWKYNREDRHYKDLLSKVPYFAIWDDHEVVNDFGPLHDTRNNSPYIPGEHLLPLGLAAFLDYNPIDENPETPKRLYRNIQWGKHVELFILDTRQYRDANFAIDDSVKPKTMLGREQLVWLKDKLTRSDATWKVIVSSVPMSIPTGSSENGRDGWANFDQNTGFEYELLDILRFMKKQGMHNTIWITTDVHFAAVFRYMPFIDDSTFQVYEFVTGPLNAGLSPKFNYDTTTLGTERLFLYGPDGGGAGLNYEQAKLFMNFGLVEVDEKGNLTVSISNIYGDIKHKTTLLPRG